jgi:hypothetical protein
MLLMLLFGRHIGMPNDPGGKAAMCAWSRMKGGGRTFVEGVIMGKAIRGAGWMLMSRVVGVLIGMCAGPSPKGGGS